MRKEKKKLENMQMSWKSEEKEAVITETSTRKQNTSVQGNLMERVSMMYPEKRYHILLVDDDIRVLKMMKEILKDHYDTAVATNGQIALKFLEKHSTDMILLDYMMPGQNGKEVLEKIRQNPKYSEIPVIFLTGVSDAKHVKECLALRPQGYLLKPVKQEELLKKLDEVLGA